MKGSELTIDVFLAQRLNDTLNRLTNMVDGVGSTLFTWTDGDQLASEDGPWADDTVSYSYDHRLRSALNLAQPNASDWTQSYVYDTVMRLTNVVSAAGSFAYHYYDYMEGFAAVDRVSEILLPAHGEGYNLRILNTYDGLMRLTDTTLYGSTTLNRDDTAYILDTFPIVKRKDEAQFNGDYRTKRVILEIYDALAEAQRTSQPYATRLNPAPASIQVAHAPRFDHERVTLEVGDYILGFVFSMLRYSGGSCDLMRLVRGYALQQQPQVLASLVEAQFDAPGRKWVEKSSQPHDGRWFLPILRRMETHDAVSFEVRGDDVIVHQKDAQGPKIDAAVGTDAFLVMRVLDVVPDKAVAEPIKRIVPKAPRVALEEATIPA